MMVVLLTVMVAAIVIERVIVAVTEIVATMQMAMQRSALGEEMNASQEAVVAYNLLLHLQDNVLHYNNF
jgi:hypothetical protein